MITSSNGSYQLKLTDLTSVKQDRDETVITLSVLKRLKTIILIFHFLIPT
jgi:hypothetical protein